MADNMRQAARSVAKTAAAPGARLSADRALHDRVQALNEAVGASARRVFRCQSLSARSPVAAVRAQLPELSELVASLELGGGEKSGKKSVERALAVFRDPRALWLSRSARESGVSALLARLLVEAAVDSGEAEAAEFVARAFFDALLTSCSIRMGAHCKACEWRHKKPKYPAMPCALIWGTLLPFVEVLARLWPRVVAQVLEKHYAVLRPQRMHVNCVFAQITGFWMLLERLNGVAGDNVSASLRPSLPASNDAESLQLMQQLLHFVVRVKILGEAQATGDLDDASQGSDFDDMLMEKFFANIRDFSFTCSRSQDIVNPALLDALKNGFERVTRSDEAVRGLFPSKVAMLTASSCLVSSNFADKIITTLLKICEAQSHQQDCFTHDSHLLHLAVGLASHVDLVTLDSLLKLLAHLVDHHDHSTEKNSIDFASLYYIIYAAVHRRDVLEAHKARGDAILSSKTSGVRVKLLAFQERVLSIDPLVFRAVPLQFMRIFWMDWIGLSDEDVDLFQDHCQQAMDDNTNEEPTNRAEVLPWESVTRSLPFRSINSAFKILSSQIQPHWIPPVELDSTSGTKRRRRSAHENRLAKKPVILLNQEQTERVMNVLLLPEMMERICSFMSAKRLCRIASVCTVFAEVSRRDTLWRGLWKSLTDKEQKPILCTHGPQFQHSWLEMYRARLKSRRKVRRLQKELKSNEREIPNGWYMASSSDSSATNSSLYTPRICEYCDCTTVLTSRKQAGDHLLLHKTHQCNQPDCGASFSSATKFELHTKIHRVKYQTAPPSSQVSGDDCGLRKQRIRVPCGFEGCKKTYVSMKRLETHQKEHHQNHMAQASAASDQKKDCFN